MVAACGDGSIYVVGKDSFNALWSRRYIPGAGFQPYQLGGGVVQGKPSVTCGNDNAIELLELQPEGKKRMSTRDFVHGYRPQMMESLG